jgi:hypothetical protein
VRANSQRIYWCHDILSYNWDFAGTVTFVRMVNYYTNNGTDGNRGWDYCQDLQDFVYYWLSHAR